MTPTPEGTVRFTVSVVSELTGKPVVGAQVRLQGDGYNRSRTSESDGTAQFPDVKTNGVYTLTVALAGFVGISETVAGSALFEPLRVALLDSVTVEITRVNIHIRTGPAPAFGSLGLATPGDNYRIIGQNRAGDWLLIDADFPVNAWIARIDGSMQFAGDLDALPIIEQ